MDKTVATVRGYVGLRDRKLPRCRTKGQFFLSHRFFSKKIADYTYGVCMCICMCHSPNGRVASSDTAR